MSDPPAPSAAPVLVTGAAGFIGYHLAERLLYDGRQVHGVDNLNPYYSVQLKLARLARLRAHPGFSFERLDLADREACGRLFKRPWTRVVHLAAQAGVRYAARNPAVYVDSNLVGFANLLEGCRGCGCEHLLFASSSSVYGGNTKLPLDEADPADHPLSLYAATKRANELMAHSYSHLFELPVTGVRFFTVYGPWGRPDMAVSLFTDAILAGRPLQVFNEGRMSRDYTYVEDVAAGLARMLDRPPRRTADTALAATPQASGAPPFRLYNLGNRQPVSLLELIRKLEQALSRQATLEMMPLQAGDVVHTLADIDSLAEDHGFTPCTSLDEGLARFVAWRREHPDHWE